MAFAHLHVHTEYSLLDGSNKIKEYVARVKELGMNSAAITDHGVMYGVIDFYRAAREAGIKPILGCEVYVAPNSRFDKELTGGEDRYHHLVLLAENNTGYANLMKIVSRGFTEGYYYKPRVDMEVLQEFHEGIIALSACLAGEVPRFILKGMKEEARKAARKYEACFGKGNYFLELQDHGIPEQRTVNMELLQMSRELDIPLVTTNDVHYTYAEDAIPHDILLCLQTGKKLADDFLEAYIFADMPTLSVLDLRYVPELYAALESYWGSAYTALQSGSYGAFSQVRSNVREFGDNEYDQVDLSDLATLTKQSLSLGTEDDVQAAAEAIRALGDDIYGIYQPVTYNEFYKVAAQYGGSLLSEDGTQFTINSPENVEAAQMMVDRVLVSNVQPTEVQMGGMGDWDLFMSGRLGMIPTGIWAFSSFADGCDFDWDIVVEPGAKQKATAFFSNACVINADSEHKDAAATWITWLCSSDAAA